MSHMGVDIYIYISLSLSLSLSLVLSPKSAKSPSHGGDQALGNVAVPRLRGR